MVPQRDQGGTNEKTLRMVETVSRSSALILVPLWSRDLG